MLLAQQQIIQGALATVNTFIGGVGATTVTSAADLASLTSLTIYEIRDFSIDANKNVSCAIETNYTINTSAFKDDLELTYFIDLEGYITSLPGVSTFSNTKNLEIFYLPSITSAGLSWLNINGVGTGVKMDIFSATALTPIGSTAANSTTFNNRQFDYLYSNSANETNNGGLPDGAFSSVNTTIDNLKYSSNTDSPSAATGLSVTAKGATWMTIQWSAVTHTNSIDSYLVFANGNYIGKSTTTEVTFTLFDASTSYSIKIIAIDEYGNISPFSSSITETTNASDITDLDLVTAYGTALKADWTFGLNSGIDEYEVYVDDVLNKTVTQQEVVIVGLTLNTEYDVKVRGKYLDGNYTTYSNILTDSTEVSEDIPYGSLLSYFRFNGNSLDVINNNNGTDTSMSYISGLIDDCADFNGTTSKINLGNSYDLVFNDGVSSDIPFSMSMLVNFDDLAVNNKLITRHTNTTGLSYIIQYNGPNNRYDFVLYDGNTSNRIHISYLTPPTVSTWVLFTITYDGSGLFSGMNIYINNSVVTTTNYSSGSYSEMSYTSQDTIIGADGVSANKFNGKMNALAIFRNKELTLSEVSAIYTELVTNTTHLI